MAGSRLVGEGGAGLRGDGGAGRCRWVGGGLE